MVETRGDTSSVRCVFVWEDLIERRLMACSLALNRVKWGGRKGYDEPSPSLLPSFPLSCPRSSVRSNGSRGLNFVVFYHPCSWRISMR